MHVYRTDFNGNPNVGLYVFASDKYCLIGKEVSDKHIKQIETALKVPVHKITIAGTSLLGVFLAGNSDCLLIPEIVFEEEIKAIENLGIKYKIINTNLTALGNNILCNDKGALVNPEFKDKDIKQIKEALDVNVKQGTIAGLDTTGSLAVINDKGCLVHNEIKESEIKIIEKLLEIKISKSTINLGNPYIGSGLAANTKGFIVGKLSGGPELVNIEENLGFL